MIMKFVRDQQWTTGALRGRIAEIFNDGREGILQIIDDQGKVIDSSQVSAIQLQQPGVWRLADQ